MGMGHGGLVAYVEAQIERDIALGRIHPSGRFGSEAKLARHYDVCRGTIREALRRLAARGVVVQRPGRKTRAVPLDESLSLENLGLALHDTRSPEARWLLEGYFSLRRQVLVELLSDCCARASKRDLDQLGSICFGLWDAARWESGASCAQVEFELLRLAARVANRPGHVLLVQSLQRAFMVGAAQLLPHLGGEPLRQWANCAKDALHDRDTRAIQQELPTLMKVCDERLLEQFLPAVPDSHRVSEGIPDGPVSAGAPDEALEARPCVEEPGLGHIVPATPQDSALAALPGAEMRDLGVVNPAAPGFGACGPGSILSTAGDFAVLGVAPCLPPTATEVRGECAGSGMGSAQGGLADRRTGWETLSSEENLQRAAACAERGSLRGILGRWAARLWRFLARAPAPPSS
ncbi:FadR family transcriptional regulator [Corallococcus interemptor]|uniref:FadR family transcriptional regulator n=1 Tax=Corallococcus interemptor TaxID=2316720 RepID=A0A3A8PN81_9BACT|nr:GntR family transcriptional regulator [Corallococcus interemptor]RKH57579.1 FadR family transcriptional regulator [Corallococcus interemptor]